MLPSTPTVTIRFGSGAAFGPVLVLGSTTSGKLGQNVLGTSITEYVSISNIRGIAIRRGKDQILDNYNAGTATITFLDTNGAWNPTNTTSYGTKIKPFNQVQIQTVYNSTTYTLFTGYVQSWDYDWQPGTGVSQVTIQAVDAFRLFSLAGITTVTGAAAGDAPGTRIGQILNQINWPTTYRQIDSGGVTVQADPGTERDALSAIQEMEDAELGAFFIDGSGQATFLSRVTLATLAATALSSVAQFRDTVGTWARYETIDVSYDDNDLANNVVVTRQGGTPQTATNTASVTEYYRRTLARDGLLLQTDAQALAQANSILNYRSTIQQLVQSISVNIARDSNTATTSLGLDLADPIYVVRTPISGPAITFRSTVSSISHDISPNSWRITIGTANPLSTAFILGNTEFGILGTSSL